MNKLTTTFGTREYLKEILSPSFFADHMSEDYSFRAILLCLVKKGGYKLIIGGGTKDALTYAFICFLKSHDIQAEYIIDDEKNGIDFFGTKCTTLENMLQILSEQEHQYIAIFPDRKGFAYNDVVISKLYKNGCVMVKTFDLNIIYPYWAFYYKNNANALMELYDQFIDKESRIILCEYVSSIIFDRPFGKEELWHPTSEKYIDKGVYRILDKEYVVCCGANVGDTFCNFLCADFPIEKMYLIEGDSNLVKIGKQYLSLLPDEINEKAEWYDVFVDKESPLDSILAEKKVTLIEMDIEGAELLALECCKKVIKEQRPVVSVCAYHKLECLVELPKFFNDNFIDYTLFLRKYSMIKSSYNYMKSETLLYAVPNERCL